MGNAIVRGGTGTRGTRAPTGDRTLKEAKLTYVLDHWLSYHAKFLLSLSMLITGLLVQAQLHDMRWLGGYDPQSTDPQWGGNKTMFHNAPPAMSIAEDHGLYINRTVGVYTDELDSIVAYTNGWMVANAELQVMPNGSGLNPSTYVSSNDGFTRPGSHVFLPWPGKLDSIAMIHMIIDTVSGNGTNLSAQLYLSVVDFGLDNGLGDLTLKNHVLLHAPLICGGLSAVRHANGRDWWVFTHGYLTNEFISFLLTPSGFLGPYYQSIGSVRTGPSPSINFSMAGDRLASVATGSVGTGLDVFDFDRCTGLLSNWQHADQSQPLLIHSGAFSPSGNFIYVARVDTLYQYPLVDGVLGEPDTVASYDGFYDGQPIFGTYFSWGMSLAANGWIYNATGNSTHYMHAIHEPDEPGTACDVAQHEHVFPTWTINSIPYRPNYLLGPIDGSVCDSLGITVGVTEAGGRSSVHVQPNPSNGSFSIGYAGQAQAGNLEILDAAGRMVYQHRLSAWSTVHQVELPDAAPGLYQCRLRWVGTVLGIRVMITQYP